MLVGELMSWETVSFNVRYGWSVEKHGEDMKREMRQAGLHLRLAALGDADA